MTVERPRVTVLLPVYNGERHLRAAIDSVLAQTFASFELLIVDDGSTDGTVSMVRAYTDPRVRLVARGRNLGLVATLNEGLALARGEYIARQDADDVLLPERLARQVSHLDAHPEIAALGSAVQLLTDDDQVVGTWGYPQDRVATQWAMLFNSPLAHSATTFRASLVREAGGYSDRLPHVEDYELWTRLLRTHDVVSLPEPLQRYRLSEAGVSRRQEARQRASRLLLAQENMTALLGRPVDADVLEAVIGSAAVEGRDSAVAGIALIADLWSALRERHPLAVDPGADLRGRYFEALLGLLARVPSPTRQFAAVATAASLPAHPVFLASLGKLLLKVWT